MAKVNNNIVTQGLSGMLGNQLVFRNVKGGRTIVATRPSTNREQTPSQAAHREAFRQAIAYGRSSKNEAVYIAKAENSTMSAFNAAVADWFGEPEVLGIFTNNWTGQIGHVIRVQAMDDIHVASVHVAIYDTNGSLLEQGDAVKSDGLWWNYATTTLVASPSDASIIATAKDLPGNVGEFTWQNN